MPPVVLFVAERRAPDGDECARPGAVARGPALRIPFLFSPRRPPGEVQGRELENDSRGAVRTGREVVLRNAPLNTGRVV